MSPSNDVILAHAVTADPVDATAEEPILATAVTPNSPSSISRRGTAPRQRGLIAQAVIGVWWLIGSLLEWLFGIGSMVIGLSLLASIPIVQFLTLGYLLDLAARVVHTGRIRDAFRDVRSWARVGGAAFATWLLLQPLRLISDLRYSAWLLGDDVRAERMGVVIAVGGVLVVVHVAWAIFRGGQWRHFLWPAPLRLWRRLRAGGMYAEARDRVLDWFSRLRVPYYFERGLKGFVVALAWLAIPVSVMVLATRLPEGLAVLLSFIGGLLLATVLLYLPFLQTNYAADGVLSDGFDWRRVRAQFRRAPIAYWFSLMITLAFALPLYVLKAELIPREAVWLPCTVFVLSILPARILVGWAVSRANRRDLPRHFIFRAGSRLMAIPVVLIYALIVYITQYISWYGAFSLYEQHAFLLPVPFLGW